MLCFLSHAFSGGFLPGTEKDDIKVQQFVLFVLFFLLTGHRPSHPNDKCTKTFNLICYNTEEFYKLQLIPFLTKPKGPSLSVC